MNIDFYLVIGIIMLCIILSYIYVKNTKEFFDNHDLSLDPALDIAAGIAADSNNISKQSYNSELTEEKINEIVEQASSKYCPVKADYNPRDFVRKTEIDLVSKCEKQPDLKDYVLKSTIPPIQKCPSCICPKVKIEAGLTKECPIVKNNCPPPQPCGVNQCRNVIKCEPGQKQVHCPKCPAPKPCPQLPQKVCPALSLPKQDFKCPEPKPCSLPQPCKDGEGRCPEKKCPKCTFKGIDTVVNEKSTEEMVSELLDSQDPKLNQLLETLKKKLNLQHSQQTEQSSISMNNISAMLNQKFSEYTSTSAPTAAPTAAPTTSSTNMEIELNDTDPPNNNDNNSISSNNNVYYNNNKNPPQPFDNNCKGDQCSYNTELNI